LESFRSDAKGDSSSVWRILLLIGSKMPLSKIERDWFNVHFGPSRADADGRWYASKNALYFSAQSPPRAKSYTSEVAMRRAFMDTYLII
jgi:hypothetical protein